MLSVVRVAMLQFEQSQSSVDWSLQEVHGDIELDQVASKNGIGIVELDQVKETGGGMEEGRKEGNEVCHTLHTAALTSPL